MAINSIPNLHLRNGFLDAVTPKTLESSGNGSPHTPVEPVEPVEPVAETDQFQLTRSSLRLRQQLEAQTEPLMDEAKIEALRKTIADGRYQVDSRRLAGRILDFEGALTKAHR